MLPQCYPPHRTERPPRSDHKLPQRLNPRRHPNPKPPTSRGKPPATTAAQPRKMRLAELPDAALGERPQDAAADNHSVDLVGAVVDARAPGARVHRRKRRP